MGMSGTGVQIVGVAQNPDLTQESTISLPAPVQSSGSMSKIHQVILIHPDAAPKPAPGAPCNGCGVCCLLEPCPLGVVLSGRRHGACVAVRWHEGERQYRCGALSEAVDVLHQVLPRPLRRLAPWLSPGLAPALARLARRWIAAGQGCDSTVEPSESTQPLVARINSSTMRHDIPAKRP
jgi:hypothetical protein